MTRHVVLDVGWVCPEAPWEMLETTQIMEIMIRYNANAGPLPTPQFTNQDVTPFPHDPISVATRQWGASSETVFETMNEKHPWLYRGQVVPTDQTVTVEAVVTERNDNTRSISADGFLMVDRRIVYKLTDFTLKVK